MTNHPLDDAADHERASSCVPRTDSITPDQGGGEETLALDLVLTELRAARAAYGPFKSAHEGWAILREEDDELWDEVKKKPKLRSKAKMLAEAKQVAAMAIRFMIDVCGSELPRVPAPTKRRAGCKRMVDRTLSGIIVRFQDTTVYRGAERRADCAQELCSDFRVARRRQRARRQAAEKDLRHNASGITVFFNPAPGKVSVVYRGPERRSREGGRREYHSDRRKS